MENKGENTDKINLQLIEQKFDFEKAEVHIQKIFWVLLGLFILLGILGLFGNGPISKRTSKGEAFEINYEHFLREDSPGKLIIYLRNTKAIGTISINRSYLEKVKVEQVFPNPMEVQVQQDQIEYQFDVKQGGMVIFHIMPLNSGIMKLNINVQGEKKGIKQFVYF